MSRSERSTTDWQSTLTVAGVRLTVFLLLWFNAVWILDDHRWAITPFVTNVRLALWLYLFEFLIEIYRTPAGVPSRAVLTGAMLRAGVTTAAMTVIQVAVRWGVVVALTWLLLRVPTPFGWLPYVAAFVPTAIAPFITPGLLGSRAGRRDSEVVRGSMLFSYEEAGHRIDAMRHRNGGGRP